MLALAALLAAELLGGTSCCWGLLSSCWLTMRVASRIPAAVGVTNSNKRGQAIVKRMVIGLCDPVIKEDLSNLCDSEYTKQNTTYTLKKKMFFQKEI